MGVAVGRRKGLTIGHDMIDVPRAVMGEIARQQPAEAETDDADLPAGEIAAGIEPPAQGLEDIGRRSPIGAELPAEGAIAAARQEIAQAAR